MTKHTPEPWTAKSGTGRYNQSHYVEAHVYSTPSVISGKDQIAQCHGGEESAANARRIVACVNACAGIPTEALEAGALALLLGQIDYDDRQGNGISFSLEAALAKLRGED